MTAFTYERDLDHPVSAEVEQTIRRVLEEHLNSQGLEGVRVNPGLDHDGDPVLFVHLKFRLVKPGIDPRRLSDSAISLRRALWAIGERRYPHLRYDFHDDQRILGTENWRVALSSDLITTARQLAHVHQSRPRQVDLRQSISTSYYAVFHGLAEVAASRLIGTSSAAQKTPAWSRVYRALNHQTIKKACGFKEAQNYSQDLSIFIVLFPGLQERRHQADYDPTIHFKQGEALSAADDAERALTGLQTAPRDEQIDFSTPALGMTRG